MTKGLKQHLKALSTSRQDDGVITDTEWSGAANTSSALQPSGHSVDQVIFSNSFHFCLSTPELIPVACNQRYLTEVM